MILELLILIFLLWIYAGGFSTSSQEYTSISLDQQVLMRLDADLRKLFSLQEEPPVYILIKSQTKTFVKDKRRIYLVLRSPTTGEMYDYSTLLSVAIHELAHIMCNDVNHTSHFYTLENVFLQRANEAGLLPNNFQVNPDYPCQEG